MRLIALLLAFIGPATLAGDYKPIIVMISTANCPHCTIAANKLGKVDDLPFAVVKVQDTTYSKEEIKKIEDAGGFPAFRWYGSDGKHLAFAGSNTSELIRRWKYSMRGLSDD